MNTEERRKLLDLLHSPRFVDKPPAAVHAALLDEGKYHCSVGAIYRILHDNDQVRERRNQLRHPNYKKPELLASGPNQVWSWDITKLLTSDQVDLLPPVCDARHLQPLHAGLDARLARKWPPGRAVDSRVGPEATGSSRRTGDPH